MNIFFCHSEENTLIVQYKVEKCIFFYCTFWKVFSRSSYFPVQCQFELMLLRILYTSSKQEIEKDILVIKKKKRNKKIVVFMKTIYVVLHQPVPRTNSLVFLLASSSDL